MKTYDVGELEISIPNLIYNTSSAYNHDSAYWKSSVIIGANDSTHSGYDWNLTGPSYIPTSQNIYKFCAFSSVTYWIENSLFSLSLSLNALNDSL